MWACRSIWKGCWIEISRSESTGSRCVVDGKRLRKLCFLTCFYTHRVKGMVWRVRVVRGMGNTGGLLSNSEIHYCC